MSPPWLIQIARNTKKDRALLESFSCADREVPWQVEVESYVRRSLAEWAFAPHARKQDPRLFERKTHEFVGVAAHERSTMTYKNNHSFAATKLEVIAIARAWQGQRFSSGERASDVLMSAVMADVSKRVPPRDAGVFAIVHEENSRSVDLCQRHGFTEELSRPESLSDYRRLVTAHQRRR